MARHAEAHRPPPGTYAPDMTRRNGDALPRAFRPTAAVTTAPPELSEAGRRCLGEIADILERLVGLLREHALDADSSETELIGARPVAVADPGPESNGEAENASPRLVAMELAVAGQSRRDVRRRLAAQFGAAQHDELLDEVFGVASGPDSRMPWSPQDRSA